MIRFSFPLNILFLTLLYSLVLKGCSTPQLKDGCNALIIQEGEAYKIKDSIDLKGQTVQLPSGVSLVSDGGLIYNGTLVGKNTRIIGKKPLFHKITIKGTWIVANITTDFFKDLEYDNELRNVFALASPNVDNEIVIKKGCYRVSASSGGGALSLVSNTKVKIEGDIKMTPNNYEQCYVILLNQCKNVKIYGTGSIYGDKNTHKGSSGEWGMGIHIINSKKIEVSGINVNDCWGDCIYIGKQSNDINIHDCILNNGRRQGISITSANGVTVSNCTIKNVSGTLPEYAIDVEPNKSNTVENVIISGVRVMNCTGGMLVYGNAKDAVVRNISFIDCEVKGSIKKYPFSLSSANNVSIVRCKADLKIPHIVQAKDINSLLLKKNAFSSSLNVVNLNSCKNVMVN